MDLMNRIPDGIALPLGDIYEDAKFHYGKGNFEKAADLFEKAIVNYRMRNDMETNCRLRCEENPLKYAISRHLKTADRFNLGAENARIGDLIKEKDHNDELIAYAELMERVSCLKTCKEEHPFYSVMQDDVYTTQDQINEFKAKTPYNYLQFSYCALKIN